MNFKTNCLKIENDLAEVVRSFDTLSGEEEISHECVEKDGDFYNKVIINGKEYHSVNEIPQGITSIEKTRLFKKHAKLLIYDALYDFSKEFHPWGALTGIRPVKLYRFIEEKERLNAYDTFRNTYKVSKERTDLTKSIYEVQKPIFAKNGKGIDLYIGIPFCVSRCYYCSFISVDLRKTDKKIVDLYLDALISDIISAKEILKDYDLRSVYIGGGTPTSLNEAQLERLLSVCDFNTKEFTVEAGRPDTITEEKLKIISKVANRISVNPQTAKDETLQKIGRSHTFKDFLDCYEAASKYGFTVNCDLIAGLVDESADDFARSVKLVSDLSPDNVTLHTLALKAGSKLKEKTDKNINGEIYEMISRGYDILAEKGYNPYYVYRQKYMAGNLENTGFYKKSPCVYNIDIMEEDTSNLACGANAISKRFYIDENRIERFAYPKDVPTYIEKLKLNVEKRGELFKK